MVEPGVADEASGKDSDVLLKHYTIPPRIDDKSRAGRSARKTPPVHGGG